MRHYCLTLFVSLFSSTAIAGVTFQIETKDYTTQPPSLERSTIHADGVSLVMKSAAGQQTTEDAMIFRGDRREMIVVDHSRQSYMVIDRRFAENMMGQLNQVAGQAKAMLDSVPADQRAMVEQMMKQGGPQNMQLARPQIQVRNVGNKAQVYGYPCILFEVTSDGRKTRDVWVTNWNNINGARELAATFDSMSEFMQELMAAFPAQAQSPMEENAFATLKQMGGFPVATREYRVDGTVESETALRSATLQSINPATFQPPQGYRQESMFGDNTSQPFRR